MRPSARRRAWSASAPTPPPSSAFKGRDDDHGQESKGAWLAERERVLGAVVSPEAIKSTMEEFHSIVSGMGGSLTSRLRQPRRMLRKWLELAWTTSPTDYSR